MNKITTERKRSEELNSNHRIPPSRKGPFTRQSLSPLGKIALIASIVGAWSGTGGVIGIRLGTGQLSLDLLTTTIFWLTSAVILSTRFRVAPAVNILIAGYLLFRIFTEPFVFESLSNPYGPDGGIAKFIGMVFTAAFAMIVCAGSIESTLQNYRQDLLRVPRWLPSAFILTLVAGLVSGSLFIGLISRPPSTSTGTIYTNGVPTVHVSAAAFLQPSVTISKGSKLLIVGDTSIVHNLFNGSWKNNTPEINQEPGAPLLNDVRLAGNSVTVGPFLIAGTFHILCTLHPGMNLTIIVQ